MDPKDAARRQRIVDFADDEIQKMYASAPKPKLSPPVTQPAGANADEPHVSRESRVEGNLFKGTISGVIDATYYSYNGWNYIGAKGKANRDVYDGSQSGKSYQLFKGYGFFRSECAPNFNPEYNRSDIKASEVKQALEKLAKGAQISVASRALLKVLRGQLRKSGKIGQAIPYAWDAHHMLPMEAFYKYLLVEHIEIIQRSDYDINTGQNMIFLPAQEKSMIYHRLPAHVDNHPQYTDGLESKFKQIKQDLDKVKATLKPHQRADFMADKLHNLEDDSFDEIVLIGPTRLL